LNDSLSSHLRSECCATSRSHPISAKKTCSVHDFAVLIPQCHFRNYDLPPPNAFYSQRERKIQRQILLKFVPQHQFYQLPANATWQQRWMGRERTKFFFAGNENNNFFRSSLFSSVNNIIQPCSRKKYINKTFTSLSQ
jgi:hypothetical protein